MRQEKKSIRSMQKQGHGDTFEEGLDEVKAYSQDEQKCVGASKQGDVVSITNLIKSATEEVSANVTADLVDNAVCNDDHEMLYVLLKHYQTLLKSNAKVIELDSLYGCLDKCVHKNKLQITNALVNAIDSNDIIGNSKYIYFENLWNQAFSISNANIVGEYTRVFKRIRNDFKSNNNVYIYTILNLELLEIDRNLGVTYFDAILNQKLEKILKHEDQAEIGSRLNRPYLNYMLSSDSTLETCLRWNKMKCG